MSPFRLTHVVQRSSQFDALVNWCTTVFYARFAFIDGNLAFLVYDEEFEEVFSPWGLPIPAVRTRAESMLVLAVLLATTDALVFVPRVWATNPMFNGSLQEIAVNERLAAPEIVQMSSLQFPLTPAAEHLALSLQPAAGKPFQRGL